MERLPLGQDLAKLIAAYSRSRAQFARDGGISELSLRNYIRGKRPDGSPARPSAESERRLLAVLERYGQEQSTGTAGIGEPSSSQQHASDSRELTAELLDVLTDEQLDAADRDALSTLLAREARRVRARAAQRLVAAASHDIRGAQNEGGPLGRLILLRGAFEPLQRAAMLYMRAGDEAGVLRVSDRISELERLHEEAQRIVAGPEALADRRKEAEQHEIAANTALDDASASTDPVLRLQFLQVAQEHFGSAARLFREAELPEPARRCMAKQLQLAGTAEVLRRGIVRQRELAIAAASDRP